MQNLKEMNEDYNLSLIQIKKAVEDNNLIIFVGAGVSANSNLPNWGELINSFSAELKTAGNDIEQEDYLDEKIIGEFLINELSEQKIQFVD